MIRRTKSRTPNSVKVSFALPLDVAPNPVSVVGDFNQWDGRRAMMRRRGATGVWEIFLPGVATGAHYKFEIVARDGELLPLKADPYARQSELRPATASARHTVHDSHTATAGRVIDGEFRRIDPRHNNSW